MRYLNRLAWAAVVVGVSAAPGLAQQGSVTGGGQTTGSLSGTGGLAGGGTGGLGGGGLGGGQGGGAGAGAGQQLQTMQAAPPITAPTGTTGGGVLDASNFLAGYYANPYYQGILANAQAAPGGFGQPFSGTSGISSGATGTGGGVRANPTGVRTGTTSNIRTTTGATGLGGARTGGGGIGGVGGNSSYGVVVPLQAQITFPTIPRFSAPPVAAPQLQADLTGMLARAPGALANPAGVQVVADGSNVILRGTVRDAEEARLVEGMIRLTPGVRAIQNELTFPAAPPLPPP